MTFELESVNRGGGDYGLRKGFETESVNGGRGTVGKCLEKIFDDK